MPIRENQTLVYNFLLYGATGSGKTTFIQALLAHENVLDANLLQKIEDERNQLRNQIYIYMKHVKDLPQILKQNINEFLQKNGNLDEADAYFKDTSLQIQEFCKSCDEEIQRCLQKAIQSLQAFTIEPKARETEPISFIDIVGSGQLILYRIYFLKDSRADLVRLNSLLSTIDGIIFIWDAQRERTEENIRSFEEILEQLPSNNQYPLVIAFNKADLPNIIRLEEVNRLLAPIRFESKFQTTPFPGDVSELTIFETVGLQGTNIKRVFQTCARMITQKYINAIPLEAQI